MENPQLALVLAVAVLIAIAIVLLWLRRRHVARSLQLAARPEPLTARPKPLAARTDLRTPLPGPQSGPGPRPGASISSSPSLTPAAPLTMMDHGRTIETRLGGEPEAELGPELAREPATGRPQPDAHRADAPVADVYVPPAHVPQAHVSQAHVPQALAPKIEVAKILAFKVDELDVHDIEEPGAREPALSAEQAEAQCAQLLAAAQSQLQLGAAAAAGGTLRSLIWLAASHGLVIQHAGARLELGELARRDGDLITACEHWQIARGIFHDLKNKDRVKATETRMRQHGCPTDWVLNDF